MRADPPDAGCRSARGAPGLAPGAGAAGAARSRSVRRGTTALILAAGILLGAAASAAPGEAFLVLQPGPAAGDFAAEAFLADPAGFPGRALEHPDGWTVAYVAASPPPGWARPFEIRGGGRAVADGRLHPRYALALAEMLAARRQAIVALRRAPDPIACAPGKPDPQPFRRDGWLFLHDGVLDIVAVTRGLWDEPLGDGWDAFKADHPRDYHGHGYAIRGNASEIYFLALLFEISRAPDGVPGAFERTLTRLLGLPGGETLALNAVLQGRDSTWVLGWDGTGGGYPIFHALTPEGEHCITDSLPGGGGDWQEIPDRSLAVFTPQAGVEILPLDLAARVPRAPGDSWDPPEGDAPGATRSSPRILFRGAPAAGVLRLRCHLPHGGTGGLALFDAQGRSLDRLSLGGGGHEILWTPPSALRSGPIWARLTDGRETVTARLLLLR